MRRPVPLSLYAYLQLYAVVPILLALYRIHLFEYRPLQTWHDHWLTETIVYLVTLIMLLLCALTALTGSRWTRPAFMAWLLIGALGVAFAARYGGVHLPLLVWITYLAPLALLYAPSVSTYLKANPQVHVKWPRIGSVVTALCCVFALGTISLFMHYMLASAMPWDSLESARTTFTLPGIVLLATLFGARHRKGTIREIGLALVASVISNMLLYVDFAILHVTHGRLHSTYVLWCWIIFTVTGVGLVVHASRLGQHPEPNA